MIGDNDQVYTISIWKISNLLPQAGQYPVQVFHHFPGLGMDRAEVMTDVVRESPVAGV